MHPDEHEGLQLHARGRHGERVGGPLVVPGADHHPPGPRPPHGAHDDDGERRARRGRSRSVTHSLARSKRFQSTGRIDAVGHEAREVDGVEEVRVEGDGERDRRDRQVEARGCAAPGSPMSTRDDTAGGHGRAAAPTKKSTFQRISRLPAAIAPMPTMPNWPRLMLPPQPVSTTSETPTSAQTSAKLIVSPSTAPRCSGTTISAAARRPRRADAWAAAPRAAAAAPRGSASATPALSHVLSPVSARLTSLAAQQQRGEDHDEEGDVEDRLGGDVPPDRPLGDAEADAAPQRGRQRLEPGDDRDGEPGQDRRRADDRASGTTPVNGAFVMNVIVGKPAGDRPHDRLQAPTGTPSSSARSWFSAAARTARPASVREQEPAERRRGRSARRRSSGGGRRASGTGG